jgi:hypothetical protein
MDFVLAVLLRRLIKLYRGEKEEEARERSSVWVFTKW